jgi:hypothetical protein
MIADARYTATVGVIGISSNGRRLTVITRAPAAAATTTAATIATRGVPDRSR